MGNRSKQRSYWITSSAHSRKTRLMFKPRARAVFRVITARKEEKYPIPAGSNGCAPGSSALGKPAVD